MKNLYLALLFSPALAFAQSSDLYLFDLHTLSDVRQISNPRLLSGFNPDGYTNQPVFLDLFKLVVSAGPDTAPAQTDLYELNLRANQLTRLTRTIDREYSPGIDPEKGYISCVLVDVKKDDEQKLWKYPVDRSTGGKAVLKGIKDVGYYTWIDDEWIAVFQVGDPSQLHLYNVRTDEKRFVSSKVGRCLKKLPGGALAYIHKISEDYWFIKKIDPANYSIDVIKKTLPGSEDFEVMRDGTLLMAKGSKIYTLRNEEGSQWIEIADLKSAGLASISRLAYNGVNLLAVVNSHE